MSMFSRHKIYYLTIIIVCGFGAYLLLQKSLDNNTRNVIALMLAIFYALWGVLHHVMHHNNNKRIVLEYTLIATLGFLLINFLLQSS